MNPCGAARETNRGFVVFLCAFYAVWSLRVVLLMPVDARIESEWLQLCWGQSLRIALWVVPLLLYVRFVHKAAPWAWLRLNTLPRGRALRRGAGIITLFLALCLVSGMLIQGGRFQHLWQRTAAGWGQLLIGMSIVAVAEELLFRGYVFRQLRAARPFLPASLISAGLFLLIHWPGWLYMQGPHWGLLSLSASIFVVGWVLALVVEVTGSLWPAILLHFLNNILSAVMLASL